MIFSCAIWTGLFAFIYGQVLSFTKKPIQRQNYVFDLLFFAGTSLLGFYAMWHTPELYSDTFSAKCPKYSSRFARWIVDYFPFINLGYYISSMALSVQTEIDSGKRWRMMAHHMSSCASILLTHYLLGDKLIVFNAFIHNFCDIFLLLGKILLYDRHHPFLADLMLFIFVPIWLYARLYIAQRYVMWPVFVENALQAPPLLYALGVPLGLLLQTLQIYWTYQIARLAVRKVIKPNEKTATDDDDA